jgi:coenzyme F420 hydrogenase subunit beta
LAAASAGGAVSSLLLSALRYGLIDAALVIGRDPDRPWVPVPRLAATAAEIVDCAQATYCITPNLQVLRDTRYERIALVGLACQIEAVQKMRNLGEGVVPAVSKIAVTIELACASSTSRAGTEHLIENRLRLPLTDVTRMRYRSGDYPGEFTVWDRGGDQHRLPFHELVTEFKQFKTFRCQACPDWWSGLADISVADGDPNIFRTSRNAVQEPKASLLVTRTELGDAFVRRAVDAGDLEVRPGTFRPEESLGLQRKRNRYLAYRRSHAGPIPTGPTEQEESSHRILGDHEVIETMSGEASR